MTGLGEYTPLRLLCFKHRTSRKALAKATGLSLRTIYNADAGQIVADDTILKIADALGEAPGFVADVLAGRIVIEPEFRSVAA